MILDNVITVKSLNKTLKLLDEYRSKAIILAGGTNVLIDIQNGIIKNKTLIDISEIKNLKGISEKKNKLVIGASTTFAELSKSKLIEKYAPVLKESAYYMGSMQIRNIATIGGNIVHASPTADSVPPLMVLDASLELVSAMGKRVVKIKDFFRGCTECKIKRNEILTKIIFDKMKKDEIGFYHRVAMRKHLSISKIGVAFKANLNNGKFTNVRIALGAVAAMTILAKKAAKFLEGKPFTEAIIKKFAKIASSEATPITDVRSTKEYRRKMVESLLLKGFYRYLTPKSTV